MAIETNLKKILFITDDVAQHELGTLYLSGSNVYRYVYNDGAGISTIPTKHYGWILTRNNITP